MLKHFECCDQIIFLTITHIVLAAEWIISVHKTKSLCAKQIHHPAFATAIVQNTDFLAVYSKVICNVGRIGCRTPFCKIRINKRVFGVVDLLAKISMRPSVKIACEKEATRRAA